MVHRHFRPGEPSFGKVASFEGLPDNCVECGTFRENFFREDIGCIVADLFPNEVQHHG